MALNTYEERLAQIMSIAGDTIATFPEKLNIIYNWVMFERSLIRRDHYIKRAEKHAQRIGKEVDVLNFRYEMQDL